MTHNYLRKKDRLLALVELLRANPGGLLRSEMAYYLGVARSTIADDLTTLTLDGDVPLWEDEKRRIGIYQMLEREPEYDEPIRKLRALLKARVNIEAHYQEFFQEYPWILGTIYEKIIRHQKLDDKNVPDFVGIRVHDKFMDMFEIKPPFTPLFRSNGEFSLNFYESWDQAERYLAFARIEGDYLRRKGLNFENPKCILIAGYDIPPDHIGKLMIKQRFNPSIQVFTYNDILSIAEAIVRLIRTFPQKNTRS